MLKGVRCRILRPVYDPNVPFDKLMIEHQEERRASGSVPYLSDTVCEVTLCGPLVDEKDEPTPDAPALIMGVIDMNIGPQYYASPPDSPDDEPGRYCGGPNYCEAPGGYKRLTYAPIRIHDHWERPSRHMKPSTVGMIPMPEQPERPYRQPADRRRSPSTTGKTLF